MPPKRKVPLCGNPLYLKWLEDWMHEAKAANNNKSYYVYKKVYKIFAILGILCIIQNFHCLSFVNYIGIRFSGEVSYTFSTPS